MHPTTKEDSLVVTPTVLTPSLLTSAYRLSELGDNTRFVCTLRVPGTNFSLEEAELFKKYPTTFQSLPRVSRDENL